jgi:hypothetical protein
MPDFKFFVETVGGRAGGDILVRLIGQMEMAFAARGALQTLPACARPDQPFADTPLNWFLQPVPEVDWTALEAEGRATLEDFDQLLMLFLCMFVLKKQANILRESLSGLSDPKRVSEKFQENMPRAIHPFLSDISRIALRGMFYPAEVSPLMEDGGGYKRTAECVCGPYVYQLKYRAEDIAFSRWDEKDDFMMLADCCYSGFTPRLVVFEQRPSILLECLEGMYRAHGGEVFLGEAAWAHITAQVSPTVRSCIERFCRDPLSVVAAEQPDAA